MIHYDAACIYAALAKLILQDQGKPPSERHRLAQKDFESALDFLEKARSADEFNEYVHLDEVRRESLLDPLCTNPRFQLLMMDLAFPDDPVPTLSLRANCGAPAFAFRVLRKFFRLESPVSNLNTDQGVHQSWRSKSRVERPGRLLWVRVCSPLSSAPVARTVRGLDTNIKIVDGPTIRESTEGKPRGRARR